MYHIKDDKRARRSAKLICDAVVALMREKPFDQITITDVQQRSTVGRATFYRLFDKLPDVLELICDQVLLGFAEAHPRPGEEVFGEFMAYLVEHAEFLRLLDEHGQTDVLYRCHAKGFEALGPSVFPGLEGSKYLEYYSAALSSLLVSMMVVWTRRGCVETAEEMEEVRGAVINPELLKF